MRPALYEFPQRLLLESSFTIRAAYSIERTRESPFHDLTKSEKN
jgi:hypothetical protein